MVYFRRIITKFAPAYFCRSAFPALKRLEMRTVNLDELDYLARRQASFDVGEAAQFQTMAHKLELFERKDLINLSFCCQQATVINNFSDLEAIGRDRLYTSRPCQEKAQGLA